MSKTFDNTTVVITGAGRGIGREISLSFARTGRSLLLIGRNRESLENTAAECREQGAIRTAVRSCDLTDMKEIESLRRPDDLPPVATLINNAGYFLLKPLRESTVVEFERQWRLHALAPYLLIRKWLPEIAAGDRGLIVNIGSAGALQGSDQSGAYASSKMALLGLSRSLRRELTGSGVAVTTVLPGQTMSDSWKGVDVNPEELVHPADVADMICSLESLAPQTVAEELLLMPEKGERAPD